MQEISFWILDLEDRPNFFKAQATAGILKFVEESSSILRKVASINPSQILNKEEYICKKNC